MLWLKKEKNTTTLKKLTTLVSAIATKHC